MSAGSPENWEILETQPARDADHPEDQETASEASDDPERFNIKIDVFEGPLELLLHLVREHKLDVHDIPVAFITDQYLKYVELLKKLNINLASEYLVMASYLVYIKSRTLLPQTEDDIEEEDPEVLRQELQRQLIEYQKFKKISQVFRHAEEEQSWLFTRGADSLLVEDDEEEEAPKLQVTVFDLISAMQHLIESFGEEGVHLVDIDELEVADMRTRLLDTLENAGKEGVFFHSLFQTRRTLEVVATFLALLELIKGNLVVAQQASNFGEIRIIKAVRDE
ncbi:MAG: segregation/condensation protein A [Nitrospinae bacterium]|nr:segregation/condensation protein A [Nitrospinota bacterium]